MNESAGPPLPTSSAPLAPPPDFRALFEATPNLYLVLTPELRIVAVNDAYCRATMTVRDEIVGRGLFEVFPDNPDDADATGVSNLRASLMRVLEHRRPDAMALQKYDILRPESEGGGFELRYWAPLNSPVLDASGTVAWIIHRVEDVTETVRLQSRDEAGRNLVRSQQALIEQLRSTGGFLDALIDNMPAMLVVKSYPDFRYVLFNRAGEELMGYRRADVIGKTLGDFFPPEIAAEHAARDAAVVLGGAPQVTLEERIQTRHWGERLLRAIKVPILDKEGTPRYLLSVFEDITERKAMEQQLRQALKMEAVGQLTGGIAHDFNNLLGVIIGNLDIAAEDPGAQGPVREFIADAQAAALRGAELTRRLLAFARNQPLHPAVVDLNGGLPSLASMLRRTLGETIRVEVQPSPDLWPTLVDPAQLDEAILNLAINARDAMPKGGRLAIETMNVTLDGDYAARHSEVTAGDYVLVAVSDSGCGMTAETLERCFEPFYTTKAPGKGTGLGLSMVYGFAMQSRGHVKIYSERDHGTSVKLYLPRAAPDAAVATVATTSEPLPARGRELVLVVEDNADLRSVTVKQLDDLGYRTLAAENGPQALEILRTHPGIDLLFTDIIMPGGMTGTELARAARQLYPRLRILLTSGYTARAVASGFHDIEGLELLNKSYRRHDLALRLRKVLDAR